MSERPEHETIGEAFVRKLREWLTPEEFAEMRRRQPTAPPNVCASHDFCDANMAMNEVMEAHGHNHDEALLWGKAWDHAIVVYLDDEKLAAL